MAKMEEHSDKWPSGRANDRSFAAIRPNEENSPFVSFVGALRFSRMAQSISLQ